MILGMSVPTFTLVHTIISLVGIVSGIGVLAMMLKSRRNELWTDVFLVSTILTSVTGFLFHSKKFGPPHAVGLISLAILAVACYALYKQLKGKWRSIYVVGAVLALYLNVFVGVVQAFQKIPGLHELAPKQTELPFLIAQLAVLAAFAWYGFEAWKKFRPKKR